VTRTLTAGTDGLELQTVWRATRDATPLVALEHVALGLELLHPEIEIRIPAGRAYELSEQTEPVRPPDAAPSWPEVLLLGGGTERADRWPLEAPRSRLLAVADLPAGRAEIVNRGTGQGLRLVWNAEAQPHLWMWHEVRTTPDVWRGLTEVLCVEPSTVPHSLGLARAVDEGQAVVLDAGDEFETAITATPFMEAT
jgi:hypothetical protein